MSTIRLAALWAEADDLRDAVRALLSNAADQRCQQISRQLSGAMNSILSLAFIGQYNAGKSSIIRALTGTDEVVVDANVATDRVVEVSWQGLRLVDTPGIRAQRPEHDQLTEEAIASSDLLVFVVTAEGFDATIGDYFRDIVLERGRASECVLVVNKATQDSGTRATKLRDISVVLEPSSPEDLPVLFVDAQSRQWAEDADDDEERSELIRESGFEELSTAIDGFARRSGLRAQLTTPVYQTLNAIDEAITHLNDDTQAGAALDLLRGQRSVVRDFRRELDEQVREAITDARASIAALGPEVAAMVEPGVDPDELKSRVDGRSITAEHLVDALDRSIEDLIDSATSRLTTALKSRYLASIELMSGLNAGSQEPSLEAPDLREVRDAATSTHDLLAGLREGATKVSTFFTKNSRPGQPAHRLVYGVGRKLGVKFRPWGVVKTAERFGRVAAGVGLAAEAWSFYQAHQEKRQEARLEQDLRKARIAIGTYFRGLADAMSAQTEIAFTEYLETSYDAALDHIQGLINDTAGAMAGSHELIDALSTRAGDLRDLLNRIKDGQLATTTR